MLRPNRHVTITEGVPACSASVVSYNDILSYHQYLSSIDKRFQSGARLRCLVDPDVQTIVVIVPNKIKQKRNDNAFFFSPLYRVAVTYERKERPFPHLLGKWNASLLARIRLTCWEGWSADRIKLSRENVNIKQVYTAHWGRATWNLWFYKMNRHMHTVCESVYVCLFSKNLRLRTFAHNVQYSQDRLSLQTL